MKDQHQRQILISLNVNEPLGCWAAFCCSGLLRTRRRRRRQKNRLHGNQWDHSH